MAMNPEKYRVNTKELLKIMIDKGYRQMIDLSRASGINRKTLGDIINGSTHASLYTIIRLISFLDIPAATAGEIFFNVDLSKKL